MNFKLIVKSIENAESTKTDTSRSISEEDTISAKVSEEAKKTVTQEAEMPGEKITPAVFERWRKSIAKYASPSCIKKNGCKVKVDLEGRENLDGLRIRHEVSLLISEFMKRNKRNIPEWLSKLSEDGLVIIPKVFYTNALLSDAEDLLRTFRISQHIFKEMTPDESIWVNIQNAEKQDPKTHLRYQTLKGGYLWMKKFFPEKLKLKHKVDLYMAALTENLGILGNHEQYEISRYGSTILLSLPGCAEQVPHTDYCSNYFKFTSDRRPAYFLMFGGRNGMRINVWRGSHLTSITKIPEELEKQFDRTFQKEELYIPQDAVFIARGDTVHSGTSWPRTEKFASARYHLLFDREDLAVDDLFQLRKEFMQNKQGDLTIRKSCIGKRKANPNAAAGTPARRKR